MSHHQVVVYPTHANAKNIKHPSGGPLLETGSTWPNDGFTARMLVDKAATLDKSEGHVTAPPAAPVTAQD